MRYDNRHALNLNITWIRLMQINRCYTPIKGFKITKSSCMTNQIMYESTQNQMFLQNAIVRNDMLC